MKKKSEKKVRSVRISEDDFSFIKKRFGGLTKFLDFMIMQIKIVDITKVQNGKDKKRN